MLFATGNILSSSALLLIPVSYTHLVGRMGHVDSEVYLSSPAVAAASAIAGYIADPEKVMKGEF